VTLPNVDVEIQDGALGIAGPVTDNIHIKLGVATSGDLNTILSFTSKAQVRDTLGSGPLAEAVAFALTKVQPVYAMRVNATTAGANSAVTKTGTGTGTMTVSGTPLDAYDVIVTITRDGTNLLAATAAFTYSLDGGDTVSAEIAVPTGGTYAISGTGLTLTFVNGGSGTSFKADDTHSFTSTAPAATLSDLNDAFDALLADPREWAFAHIVGEATPSIAAGVATRMDEAETNYRFAFAVLEARDLDVAADESEDDWMADIIADYASFSSKRVEVVAGHGEVVSQLTGRIHRRSLAWITTARYASIPVQEHPGRTATGPVSGVTVLYHNEDRKPGLDEEHFTTLRTIIGRKGFYVTEGRLMAPEGSDFLFVTHRRVMDKACKVARDAFLQFMNEDVRVDDEGNIAEPDALRVEAYIDGKLESELIAFDNASSATVSLKRDSNILSTSATTLTVRVVPKGYMKYLTIDIGFRNPALEVQAS
jgi:hypothetical protein